MGAAAWDAPLCASSWSGAKVPLILQLLTGQSSWLGIQGEKLLHEVTYFLVEQRGSGEELQLTFSGLPWDRAPMHTPHLEQIVKLQYSP